MQSIPKDKVLHFHADTLEVVRRDVNLNSIERVNEAVDILQDWIMKQPHFVKKDYSREYLERTIVIAKGLVERAKARIDKLCTLKTLMPEFFKVTPGFRTQSVQLGNRIQNAFLPNVTENSCRIFLTKVVSDFDSNDVFNFYKTATMYSEYLRRNDYVSGYHMILDYRDGNILNTIAHINPVTLKHIATILFEGHGFRIPGIYLITPSKAVSLLVSLFKQVLSPKLASRIRVIEKIETLYQYVPQELMPAEYGGKEKPLREVHDEWMIELTSEKTLEYCAEMFRAATIESNRQPDMFNEQYLGMAGSFRALTVD